MKHLVLLAFLVGSANFQVAEAQSYSRSSSYSMTRLPVSQYCTSDRFENYIALAYAMRDFVTPYDYAKLYIPLRKKASTAQMTLKNYGPLSSKTRSALFEIVRFVDQNQKEFDALWEVEAFYSVARDLMDLTQTLSRDLE